jgi:tetratricopeptide (TPR) repeat protein/predicted Ser/Thr protein kinase
VSDPTPTVPDQTQGEATEAAERFKPGDRLGRYVIVSTAGQGGMSVVYLAFDPELDRKVAVKLMRIGSLGTQGKQRLQREAQALARLSHPNVVPVYDVGTVRDQAFVAMEYVEGQTLKRWLKQPRRWREVLAVMVDAGRGLAAAHAAGLVHRDFKPDNVLIGNDGRVRVLDFGLARPVEDLDGSNPSERTPDERPPAGSPSSGSGESARVGQVTRADQVIGTPAYMAPEQVANGATDERADQFSFCVTLYEALYKQKPFDHTETLSADALMTIAEKRSTGPVRHLAKAPSTPGVPGWIYKVVMRGLAVDPIHRFPSMDELLRELLADPGAARRKWVIGGVTALMLGAGVFGAVSSRRHQAALCRGGEERMAAVWSDAARTEVKKGFAEIGAPYADAAAQAVTRALDAYATAWTHMHQDACEATRVRGEQSEEVLDLRMACLSDRLKEVSALAELMRRPDAETVQEASRATQQLTPVAECADVSALKAPVPRPRDPQQRAKVDALQKRLAGVQAQYAVGKNEEAARLGDALLKDAQAVGFQPLIADVHLWRGRAHADLGEEAQSIPAYRDAFAVALASRNDRTLKQAAVRLAQEYIYKNDMNEFHYWDEVAQAALDRTGPDARMESFLQHTRCVGLWQTGKLIARLDCLEKHARGAERVQPLTDWELTTLGLAASDTGRFSESIDFLKRGVAYSLKENGYTHPRTLEMRGYLCKGWIDYGDFDKALAECRDALKTAEEVAKENHYIVSKIELYLGSTLRELKRYDEAKKYLEKARPYVKPEGEALVELAQIASATGDHGAALAFFKKSLEEDQMELAPDHPNLVVDLLQLGEAQLAHGDAAARATLGRAYQIAANADLSPYMIADVEFAYARALWPEAAERSRALTLAQKARDTYAKAPDSERFQSLRSHVAKWLGGHSLPP